jgi:hypothetical protein
MPIPAPAPVPGWEAILSYLQNLPKPGGFPSSPGLPPPALGTILTAQPQAFPYVPPTLPVLPPPVKPHAPSQTPQGPIDPWGMIKWLRGRGFGGGNGGEGGFGPGRNARGGNAPGNFHDWSGGIFG